MANDIPEVYIRVVADTGEVQRNLSAAEKAFLGFEKSTKKGRKSWGGSLTKQFASMAGGVFAVSTAMSALSSIAKAMFKDVSDFQTMSVELKVATGSAVHAEQAFSMLQDTAKMLPTSLKDLTTGFVRLKNMGLDASQRSLVSFANTAAAMGKSLKQFVEAVADANTREFERLKEFGILARNEGDKIKFVFRGVTTEVDNSSKDIVQFLTNIGNTEFAGAATEQIDTLSSRVTKLKDSLFNLNVALGSDGAGAVGDFFKLIEDKANAAAEAINMDKLQTKLTSVVKFDGGGAAWMGQGGSGGIIRVSKSISEIRNVFKKLNAKELPLAAKLIEEQKDLVDEMRESEHEDLRKQRSKLHWMVRGLKVSRERLRVQIVSAAEKAKEVADGAHSIRIDQQREQINKSFQERAFQLRLRAANQQKNILALVELETESKQRLVPINENLARAADKEVFSASQLDGFLRTHALESKTILDIQRAIAEFSQAEVDAAKELASKQAEDRKKRFEDLEKQMKLALEVGNHADYNAARAKKRMLESRAATLSGIDLTEALQEKYDDVAGSIADVQAILKEGGLGAEDLVAANDALDGFQAELDATGQALEDQKKDITDWAKSMADLFDDIKEGIADAIVEGEGFKGMLESVLKQIAKTQILSAIGGFGGGGTDASGILGMFKKPKGAFTGGPVSSGVPRIVGEKGPEIFTPSGAGMITPNHRSGGGGGNMVSVVNNFAIDGGDKQEIQGMIAQSVSASVSLAVAKMADNKRRRA